MKYGNEPSWLFVQEWLTPAHRSTLALYSEGLDLYSAIPAFCCGCIRLGLLVAYPGDCLLSIECRTD